MVLTTGTDRAVQSDFADLQASAPIKQAPFQSLQEAIVQNSVLRELGLQDHCAARIRELSQLASNRALYELIPNEELRPLLAVATIFELTDAHASNEFNREMLIGCSPILQMLEAPYRPVYLDRVINSISKHASWNDNPELRFQVIHNLMVEAGGLNSTLRNLAISMRLNQTLFRSTQCKAQIALAQYSWRELGAKVSMYDLPELPRGTMDGVCLKFVIAVTRNGLPLTYLDYGQNEGDEKYGIMPTGEGPGAIVGRLFPQNYITPESVAEVIDGLRAVARSQNRPGEHEAVRRIGLHKEMTRSLIDFVETPDGLNFPAVITSVEDLNETQLQFVLRWSGLVESMVRDSVELVGNDQLRIGTGSIFTPFQGMHARVDCDQPSTRTVTATVDALRALGMSVDVPVLSSKAKGESTVSEAVTLTAHNVDVVAMRSKDVERYGAELREIGDGAPTLISLGGNEHHPTQTLAEIKVLMDYYGVESCSLQDLRDKTSDKPPTVTFIGRTDQKRADKALISFIATHLPHWNVRVLVPYETDIPKLTVPIWHGYSVRVIDNLLDQECIVREAIGTTFLYTSNAEATSHIDEKGTGDGKKSAPHYISAEALERVGCVLMHPLPASGELQASVFTHRQSRIPDQMKNKVLVISAIAATQLMAKQHRRRSAES